MRDRALPALGFADASRRSELVALEIADLVEVRDGLRVTIRRRKVKARDRYPARLPAPRPVEAVRTWLAAAGAD